MARQFSSYQDNVVMSFHGHGILCCISSSIAELIELAYCINAASMRSHSILSSSRRRQRQQ